MPYTDVYQRIAARKKNRKRTPRPVPKELEIVQAFVNTRNLKKRTDELSSPHGLSSWLARHRLLPASEELTEDDLRRALDVREGIRALLLANNGAELDVEAIRLLAVASRGARTEVRFDPDGTVRFEAASSRFGDVLGIVLATAAIARLREDWDRFKACGNSDCQAAFWDSQRTGKWCSHRCGDQMRARSYRKGEKYKAVARRRRV